MTAKTRQGLPMLSTCTILETVLLTSGVSPVSGTVKVGLMVSSRVSGPRWLSHSSGMLIQKLAAWYHPGALLAEACFRRDERGMVPRPGFAWGKQLAAAKSPNAS